MKDRYDKARLFPINLSDLKWIRKHGWRAWLTWCTVDQACQLEPLVWWQKLSRKVLRSHQQKNKCGFSAADLQELVRVLKRDYNPKIPLLHWIGHYQDPDQERIHVGIDLGHYPTRPLRDDLIDAFKRSLIHPQRGKAAGRKTMSFKYEMGLTARDVVTGYEGVITSRCDYITGCKQYVLNAKGLHEGKPISGQWFDEDRLEVDHTIQPLRLGFEDKPQRRAVGGPQSDSPPIK